MRTVFNEHPSLWLHVRGGNRAAVALYEKLGMRELQRLNHFYSNGDDAAVMVTPDLL
jgi:ribosomal protein S18 acetylase RimI-like enzyme